MAPPPTSTTAENVFTSDQTAISVLTGIYGKLSTDNSASFTSSAVTGISLYGGLSADELTLFNLSNTLLAPFYRNDIIVSGSGGLFWNSLYAMIFSCNSAIEGLNTSTGLTPAVKNQLLGEAKFMRAFGYFYLVNLYGDVPLNVSTDYKVNALLPRVSKSLVYQQILLDLQDAQGLLSPNYLQSDALTPYSLSQAERVRPTKWAASALLARVLLYTGDYSGAEVAASSVIDNSQLFELGTLSTAFLKNTKETIFSLQPVKTGTSSNTGDGALFKLPTTGPSSIYPVYLSRDLVNAFEPGDQRKSLWINFATVGIDTFYYPFKYKIGKTNTLAGEYTILLRLAEQYLIRAEARAQLNKLNEAVSDINVLRTRAVLPLLTVTNKDTLLTQIFQERRVELFTEWGHRWFDSKRTNRIDDIMTIAAPAKGGVWAPYKSLYPIPVIDVSRNPNLIQNPGYQ
ncbi:MAG: RagB/SusD family nutrient uptake outer membrane protein [Bacteroidota bacterium]|nr:RagB/SusD family nutrient uptake outer membrane protein [Bacteroidota bacterium]